MGMAKNFSEALKAHLEGRAEDVPADYKTLCKDAADQVTASVTASVTEKVKAELAAAQPEKTEKSGAQLMAEQEARGTHISELKPVKALVEAETARAIGILKAAQTAKLGIPQALKQIEDGATIDAAKDVFLEAAAKEQAPLAPAGSYHASPVDPNAEAEMVKKMQATTEEFAKSANLR